MRKNTSPKISLHPNSRRTALTAGLILLGIVLLAFILDSLNPIPAAFSPQGTLAQDEILDEQQIPMRLVPAGEFMMGSNNGTSDQQPVHKVYLDSFYMDKYEITNAQYKACVDAGTCEPPGISGSIIRQNYYENSSHAGDPVINVDWNQARVYCLWRGARLPTEAEWEKAARGASEANHGDEYKNSAPVDSREGSISPYGVHHMAENVWEWVADWYDPNYYGTSPPSNPIGPSTGDHKVLRGGTWDHSENVLRASSRYGNHPDYDNRFIGFRCARSMAAP